MIFEDWLDSKEGQICHRCVEADLLHLAYLAGIREGREEIRQTYKDVHEKLDMAELARSVCLGPK